MSGDLFKTYFLFLRAQAVQIGREAGQGVGGGFSLHDDNEGERDKIERTEEKQARRTFDQVPSFSQTDGLETYDYTLSVFPVSTVLRHLYNSLLRSHVVQGRRFADNFFFTLRKIDSTSG